MEHKHITMDEGTKEMIHIDSALCTAQCLYSVVTRIDDALHHPEEYLET